MLRHSVKQVFVVGSCALVLLILIGFSGARNADRPIHDVLIDIGEQEGNLFIDQPEVLSLLNAGNTDYVLGLAIGEVDLKLLESRLEDHAFVQDAQVFHDLKGNLRVSITQAKPIARVYNTNGPDQYIDELGNLLPFNTKHTARVPLLELDKKVTWQASLLEDEAGQQIYDLLRYIEQDEFWKAQIAHLVLNKKGEIEMIPQVTKQRIIFGVPENIVDKFKRLEIFYKDILPVKGWNTYAVVNLKFENQIVCE